MLLARRCAIKGLSCFCDPDFRRSGSERAPHIVARRAVTTGEFISRCSTSGRFVKNTMREEQPGRRGAGRACAPRLARPRFLQAKQ